MEYLELTATRDPLDKLASLSRFLAPNLSIGVIPPFHFLMAIMKVESSLGDNNVPRFEYSYSRSSLAFKKSKLLQEGYAQWGDLCAMSYGPAQILWIVAKELGYSGHPLELWKADVSLPYVVTLLNKSYLAGGDSLEKLAAVYNGGAGCLKKGATYPDGYVRKFIIAFSEIRRQYS